MKCKNIQEIISLYLDNKLSSAEKEQLKHHLESCSSCKEEYIAVKNIKNLLSGLKTSQVVDDGFTDSVMNKIKNKTYDDKPGKIFTFNFIKKHFLIAASFIFVVAASSSVLFMKSDKDISNFNKNINQNKIQNEVAVKSQLKDNGYYVSIIESIFNDGLTEDDDFNEDFFYSFSV